MKWNRNVYINNLFDIFTYKIDIVPFEKLCFNNIFVCSFSPS